MDKDYGNGEQKVLDNIQTGIIKSASVLGVSLEKEGGKYRARPNTYVSDNAINETGSFQNEYQNSSVEQGKALTRVLTPKNGNGDYDESLEPKEAEPLTYNLYDTNNIQYENISNNANKGFANYLVFPSIVALVSMIFIISLYLYVYFVQ